MVPLHTQAARFFAQAPERKDQAAATRERIYGMIQGEAYRRVKNPRIFLLEADDLQ